MRDAGQRDIAKLCLSACGFPKRKDHLCGQISHHTPGQGHLAFLSALAEDERGRILARANGGRAAAKKRGVKFGPKPKLAHHQNREVARMVHIEGLSLRAVAHHYHVGHSTIVRALERTGSIT